MNRRMPNGTYGGVRGKETKVGQKTFVSRPTRFLTSSLFLFSALGHAVMSFRALGASKQVEELHKASGLDLS